MKKKASRNRVGDFVEVRSKAEILSTLDSNGCLDGMPFMPEMFAFCGKRFPIYKSAHKTCDTVFPVRGRRVEDTVHLDTRCDGSAHGGCQAGCLLFWKQAWFKPIDAEKPAAATTPSNDEHRASALTESDLVQCQIRNSQGGEPLYSCQATQLPYATNGLNWWDLRQYAADYRTGNVTVWLLFCGAIYFFFYSISCAGIGLGRPIRWFFDKFYPLWGGTPFPRRLGLVPNGESTPSQQLDLQPGEIVRVKPYKEILKTLNTDNMNRGMYFDAEEVPYCGQTHRVLQRVSKIIDEKTGKMLEFKTPCIILDSVVCQSRFSECRLFCPRSIYAYWREIWLERVDAAPPSSLSSQDGELASQCEAPGR